MGVKKIRELVEFGKKNLEKYKFNNVKISKAGKKLGARHEAPFDKILVSAESKEIPEELLKKLRRGGIMVIPIQNGIWKIKKISETEKQIQKFKGFIFVPLVGSK